MKKFMTIAAFAVSLSLGLSADIYNGMGESAHMIHNNLGQDITALSNTSQAAHMHNNVIIRDLPANTQEDLQHHTMLGENGAGTQQSPTIYEEPMYGQTGPITLKLKGKEQISLPITSGTGYQWVVTSCNPEGIVKVTPNSNNAKKNTTKNKTSKSMVGASTMQEFTITAKKAGNTICTFEYKRGWEKNSAPAKTETHAFIVTE